MLGDFFYEIGYYVLAEKKYAYMCKWKKDIAGDGSVWKKEYEAVSGISTDMDALTEIRKARERMIRVSGKKDNTKTVSEMYLKDAFYYTHGGLCRGHREIAAKFYPDIQFLELETKVSIQPKDDMVYEIGMYVVDVSSGYYTVIWRKDRDEWKIYLDSNE